MDVTADLDADCSPARLWELLRDLGRYPSWLSIVPRAELETASNEAAGEERTWSVELRAKVGPLARSKRLRMVRTIDEQEHVRFERRERDGREHSPWVLDALIGATPDGSRVTMALHYGGGLGGAVVERMLRAEIDASRPRLRALAEMVE